MLQETRTGQSVPGVGVAAGAHHQLIPASHVDTCLWEQTSSMWKKVAAKVVLLHCSKAFSPAHATAMQPYLEADTAAL